MKKFYIMLFLIFLACIFLFIGSFLYIDRAKHHVFYYVIENDAHPTGTIKIDSYITDEKFIYKGSYTTPFDPLFAESRSKITLDKAHAIETYSHESYGDGVAESAYIENRKNIVSFVALSQSGFSLSSAIPITKETFIFAEDSPETYLPILERYDFRRGRSQGFNTLTCLYPLLPPMKRLVTLTSIRDEYLTIDSKKIKTECLLLKIRNYPQGTVWVAKSDKSLIMIAIPTMRLRIVRTFVPKKLEAKTYSVTMEAYTARDIAFKSGAVTLTGTLTAPKTGTPFPAIILIPGDGPYDRDHSGLFASIADGLTRAGFLVVRLDKRGTGQSGGDAASTTAADMVADTGAALDYLKTRDDIATDRIHLIGRGRGALYAIRVATARTDIKTLVLLSPATSLLPAQGKDLEAVRETAKRLKWTNEYLAAVLRTNAEIIAKIKGTKRSWISVLGKRCFLDAMRERLSEDLVGEAKKVRIPVLVMQGKEGPFSSLELAAALDRALEEGGNKEHLLTYFSYLSDFLGKKVDDGRQAIHYEVDAGVLEALGDWLRKERGLPSEQPLATGQK